MKPEPRSSKHGMALTPSEWRAVKWYAKRHAVRGLAALRLQSLGAIVDLYAQHRAGPIGARRVA